MEPIARNWLETVANVRTHGETGKRPMDMFAEEKTSLQPLPVEPCDFIINCDIKYKDGQGVKPVKLWLPAHTDKNKTRSIAY